MNFLVATIGTSGDVNPFVGLGLALQSRGHHVTLLTNGHFESLARKVGLDFQSLGPAAAYQRAVDDPQLFHGELAGMRTFVRELVGPAVEPLYRAIAASAAREPTVVAASSLSFGARVAQDHLGVPVATVHLQPTVLPTIHDLPTIPRWVGPQARRLLLPLAHAGMDMVFGKPVQQLRRALGLPPVKGVITGWGQSPLRVIGLFPQWYAPPQPDWPPQVRLTGFPLYDGAGAVAPNPEAEAFLAAGPPPILFTAGSAMAHAAAFFRESVAACERLGCRGMLLAQYEAQIPPGLPAAVRHFRYLPFGTVLARCGAVVHHGGIGTLSQCFAAGVPQLVVPLAFDQPDGAARVVRLGTGSSLNPEAYRAEAVAAHLRRLLDDPNVRQHCTSIAERVGTDPGFTEACLHLEELEPYASKASVAHPG